MRKKQNIVCSLLGEKELSSLVRKSRRVCRCRSNQVTTHLLTLVPAVRFNLMGGQILKVDYSLEKDD